MTVCGACQKASASDNDQNEGGSHGFRSAHGARVNRFMKSLNAIKTGTARALTRLALSFTFRLMSIRAVEEQSLRCGQVTRLSHVDEDRQKSDGS